METKEPLSFVRMNELIGKSTTEPYVGGKVGGDYKEDDPMNGRLLLLGLAGGTYTLAETKAPEGYNMSPEIKHFTVKETYKNDGTVYWVDQPRRFKKFGFLYATGDDSPPLLLLAADLLVLLIAYILVSRKDKKHEKDTKNT